MFHVYETNNKTFDINNKTFEINIKIMSFDDIMKSSVAGSAVGAIGSIGSSLLSNSLNQKILRQQQAFAAAEAQKERDFASNQMAAQMSYNSPISQLAMMRGAGLNVMGDSVNPMSATPTQGASAVAPGSPQMSMDFGQRSLSEMLNAFANLNASEAAGVSAGAAKSQADTAASKAPSEILSNKEQANLFNSQSVWNDWLRQPMEMVYRAQASQALADTEQTRLMSSFYPALVSSEIGLNDSQAKQVISSISQKWAELANQIAIARMQNDTARLGIKAQTLLGQYGIDVKHGEWQRDIKLAYNQFRLDALNSLWDATQDNRSYYFAKEQFEKQFEGLGSLWNFLFGSSHPLGGTAILPLGLKGPKPVRKIGFQY